MGFLKPNRPLMLLKHLTTIFICFTFILTDLRYACAQNFIDQLPAPGQMVGRSSEFSPLVLKGLIVNPRKPLEFQFIIDPGKGLQNDAFIKAEAGRLVKYFFAG